MCTNPDRPWPAWDGSLDYDYDSIIRRLVQDRDRIAATESIYLTGGEPTLHPQFLKILGYLVKNFPEQKLKLLTNGRTFFYEDFAVKVLKKAPELEIELSLHGPGPGTHDRITGAEGSFAQSAQGLKNLLNHRKKQKICIRTVLGKSSYRHIRKTLQFFLNYPELDRVIVLFPELEGQGLKDLDAVRITYLQVRTYLEKCIDLFPFFNDIRLYHFPLCVISGKLWPYIWRTLPEKEVAFSKNCRACRVREFCLGAHKGYLKNAKVSEFRPIRKKLKIQGSPDPHSPIRLI